MESYLIDEMRKQMLMNEMSDCVEYMYCEVCDMRAVKNTVACGCESKAK